jgi:hypothetical protein
VVKSHTTQIRPPPVTISLPWWEGGSSGPIGKGEGKSEMEEGRGTAQESLERWVRERGCEVWKMDEGGEGGRH